MTTLTNSFEGGTNGTTITTGNSGGASGNAFDFVGVGAGATNEYSNAQAAGGTLSCQLQTVAGVADDVQWNTAGSAPSVSQMWFRLYVYITSNPGATVRLWNATNGAGSVMSAQLNSTGHIIISYSPSGTIFTTFTTAVNTNGWFRVEGFCVVSATVGQVSVSLYNSPGSGSATETHTSGATLNTASANPTTYSFGNSSTIANIGPWWIDNVGLSTTGALGPANASYTEILAGSVSTITGTVSQISPRYFTQLATFAGTQLSTGRFIGTNAISVLSQVVRRVQPVLQVNAMSAAGPLTRTAGKPLTPVSAANTRVGRSVNRQLAQTMNVFSQASRAMTRMIIAAAAVQATAVLARFRQFILVAAVVTSGLIVRLAGKNTATQVTVSGNVARAFTRLIPATAVANSQALLTKLKMLSLAAAAVAAGAYSRAGRRSLAAGAVVQGTAGRQAGVHEVAAVAAAAGVNRGFFRALAGQVAAIAQAVTIGVVTVILSAVSVTSGSLTRRSGKLLAGPAAALAASQRSAGRKLNAALTITAQSGRGFARQFIASVTASPAVLFMRVQLLILIADVAARAALSRQVRALQAAAVIVNSGIARVVGRPIQGSLTSAGQTVRQAARVFSGNIAVVLALSRNVSYIIAAGTTMSAATQRAIAKSVAGKAVVQASAGKAARKLFQSFASALAFISTANPHVQMVALTTSVGASASAVTQIIRGVVKNLHIRVGVPFTNWVTSTIKNMWHT